MTSTEDRIRTLFIQSKLQTIQNKLNKYYNTTYNWIKNDILKYYSKFNINNNYYIILFMYMLFISQKDNFSDIIVRDMIDIYETVDIDLFWRTFPVSLQKQFSLEQLTRNWTKFANDMKLNVKMKSLTDKQKDFYSKNLEFLLIAIILTDQQLRTKTLNKQNLETLDYETITKRLKNDQAWYKNDYDSIIRESGIKVPVWSAVNDLLTKFKNKSIPDETLCSLLLNKRYTPTDQLYMKIYTDLFNSGWEISCETDTEWETDTESDTESIN